MSKKTVEALKAQLVEGGMSDYFAQQAAEILAEPEGPGDGARRYVENHQKTAEGQRQLRKMSA